jgi:pseudouridylate synthase / pseudouridine kinase
MSSLISERKSSQRSDTYPAGLPPIPDSTQYDVLVAGALAADLSCDYAPLGGFTNSETPLLLTSNPAVFSQSVGGVGHNVALASRYAGASTLLCSAVGNDATGRALIEQVKQSGLPTSGIKMLDEVEDARTAQYVAINDTKKNLVTAMADMSILSSPALESASLWQSLMAQHRPKWVVVDCNWPTSIISEITAAARSAGARVAVEPVSAQKSSRPVKLVGSHSVMPNHLFDLATPNTLELQTMYHTARDALLFESEFWWQVINALNLPRGGSRDRFIQLTTAELVNRGVPQQILQLLPYIPCILTKLGDQGCLLSQLLRPGDPRLQDPKSTPYILGRAMDDETSVGGVYMRLFPPAEFVKQEQVVSVNGVGDTMLGVMIAGLTKKVADARVEDVVMVAQEAAVRTLKSERAVSEDLRGIVVLRD